MPGDVVVLLRGKATCDMVLLTGNCLVEESMLSGEVLVPAGTSILALLLCSQASSSSKYYGTD